MAVIWKLKSFLTENKITPNALAEHLKGQLSKTAIYNLVRDEPPTSIHLDTLDTLIPALTELTDKKVSLLSLLEYRTIQFEWKTFSNILDVESQLDLDEE